MSRLLPIAAALLAAVTSGACVKRPSQPATTSDPAVRTIEQSADIPALPLPADESSAATSTASRALVDLPFTPAISMDPVDGGKVSIRPDTPVAEFKDHIYYFRNEENRQAFLRNPEKYVRGSLSRY